MVAGFGRGPIAPLFALLAACGSTGSGPTTPSGPPAPPPGPHFTVSPLPVEAIARITPVGFNNKIFPTPHTYWQLCDDFFILQSNRPCRLERMPIRAPMAAVVRSLNPTDDGFIEFEGLPGLHFHFGHVTPAPDLSVGSRVTAGQVVTTMFQTNGVDFGLRNYGVRHRYVVPTRYHDAYLHAEHPIAQFPEPLRSQLMTKLNSLSVAPLGRLSYDVEGTASGGWFLEGAPSSALQVGNERFLLWLARYVERDETRILSIGERWPGMQNQVVAVDPSAPDWESITPASGTVVMKLWNLSAQALPNAAGPPAGTFLIRLLAPNRLRMEWFETHAPVSDFTAAAKVFER